MGAIAWGATSQEVADIFEGGLSSIIREVRPEVDFYREAGRKHVNPNKLTMCRQPWFTDACRVAQLQVHSVRRLHGRRSDAHRSALARYRQLCRASRAAHVAALESLRIGSPREFFSLLRAQTPPSDIEAGTLLDHYTGLLGELPFGYGEEQLLMSCVDLT